MDAGQYISFYVNRKSQLFPLIEEYANIKIGRSITHGQLVPLYYRLLTTDMSFRADVDRMINERPYKNLVSTAAEAAKLREAGTKVTTRNSGGLLSNIFGAIGGVAGSIQTSKQAKLESDKLFYQTVLNEQKNSDTTKVIVVSAIALVFVGTIIFFVSKAKK